MYLNHCALVSSFLFVPIVLADCLEKPRRLLTSNLEQNTNAVSDDSYVPWAGGYLPDSKEDNVTMYISATGLFTVPFAWGASGNGASGNASGFSVSVSIGNLCRYSDGHHFMAGIGVHLDDSGVVSYTAYTQWGNVTRFPGPQTNITIGHGEIIQATVKMKSHTTGLAILENLTRKQKWEEPFDEHSAVCQQTAEWLMTAIPDFSGDPVPMFDIVFFSNASVERPGGVPPGEVTFQNMVHHNTTFTAGGAGGNTVFFMHKSEILLVNLEDDLEELSWPR